MNQTKLNIDLEKSLADRLADEAMKQLTEDEIKSATELCIGKFRTWRKSKNSFNMSYESTEFEQKILKHFYSKVGVVIEKLLTEDEEFTANVEDEARDIIRMARQTAEKYMVEAMANRMCINYTNFDNNENKYEINRIVYEIMNRYRG